MGMDPINLFLCMIMGKEEGEIEGLWRGWVARR